MMTDIVERLERLATWGGKATHLDYEGAILDAKAEIERLRDENARPHLNYEAVMLESKGEIDRLRADNERLRAALREIVDREADASGGARLADFHDIRCACGRCAADIARAALEAKDD